MPSQQSDGTSQDIYSDNESLKLKSQSPDINQELKHLVIQSYYNDKDEQPRIAEIDCTTGQVHKLHKAQQTNQVNQLNKNIYNGLFETFLPAGYPHTVSSSYLKFTIYSNISAFMYTAMGFLSAQSLFVAIGSTMTQANLAAAAYTWVLKDGLGQLGGILFASRYGRNFDVDIKKWRFMAIFALNISMYIEILTLSFPQYFLALASLANVGKNICFLLASASRASINLQLAKNNNIGDISGKSVSQFTASTLIGGACGLGISKIIDITSIYQLYPVFFVLTVMNIAASYYSAKVIDELYLNNQRAFLLFNEFFKSNEKLIHTAEYINDIEAFYLPNVINLKICKFIKYGEKTVYQALEKSIAKDHSQSLLKQLSKQDRNFVYYVEPLTSSFQLSMKKMLNNDRIYKIHLNLNKDASNSDILKSYYFARLLDNNLQEEVKSTKKLDQSQIEFSFKQAEKDYAKVNFEELERNLIEKGWSLQYVYLDSKKNRYSIGDRNSEIKDKVLQDA
eukprot:403362828